MKTKAGQHCRAEEGESGMLGNERFKQISSLLVQHINPPMWRKQLNRHRFRLATSQHLGLAARVKDNC